MMPGRMGRRLRGARMDDRMWFDVWERTLDRVERHNIAVEVWRRAQPGDRLHAIVGFELAHRWRQRAAGLASLYLLWSVFWGAIGVANLLDPSREVVALPLGLCGVGLAAVLGCGLVRRRLRPVIDGCTGFAPAVALTGTIPTMDAGREDTAGPPGRGGAVGDPPVDPSG